MSGEVYTPHYVSASEVQHGLDRAERAVELDGLERKRPWYLLARCGVLALVYIGQQIEDVSRKYASRSVP